MADFKVDTSFMNVKPQGSSLADMINIANQTQAYQQAQQINPLKLRQEQLATQKAEEVTPEEIAQAKEITKRSKFKTQEDYVNKLNEIRGALLNSESLKNNDVKGFTKQAIELREDAKKFGIPEELAEPEFAKLISTANDPQKGLPFIQERLGNVVRTGVGATGQQALQNPQVVTLNGVNYQYTPGTNKLVPIGENQPQAQPQGQPTAQPQGMPSLIPNEVPVGQGAGPLQLNAQQKALFDEGFTTKSNAQAQVIPAKEGRQTVRRVKELAEQAASSKLGQFYQKGEKAIFGNTELDELTKNIANLQIQNASVMGVKTDQQTQNVATASGSINISPEALRDLADRTDASNTAVIKFNEGLKNYESKRGQTHAYVNTRNFKDAWASNYDPRVFMVQNINSSGMSKDAKEKAIAKINQGLSEEELKDLRQKSEAIKRLERGDYK